MEDNDLKEIKDLLKENNQLNREILKKTSQIYSYLKWMRIWGWIKFVFIVVPLILSFIYLPPLLKPLLEEYQKIFNELNIPTSKYNFDVNELENSDDLKDFRIK